MDTYSLLLTIFSAFFAIGLAFMIVTMVTAAKAIKKNTKLPKISANARATGKRMDGFAVSNKKEVPRYYATFEFDTKDTFEFQISEDCYQFIQPGDHGIIVVKGTQFISFELTDV